MARLHKVAFILLLNVLAVATSPGAITYVPNPAVAGCADTLFTNKLGTLYQWNFGPNTYPQTFTSAVPAAATVFLTPGSHTVYVIITTGGGTVGDSVTLTVQANTDTVSLTANQPVCSHNPMYQLNDITFRASPSGYQEYAFFVDDSLKQFSSADTFSTYLQIGDSVRVFGFNGTCFTNASNTLSDHTPAPPTVTSTLPASDTICAADTVTFTASPVAPGDSFLFYVGGSLEQGSSSNTYSSNTLQDSSKVYVIVYNEYGCSSYFLSNQIFVFIKPTPEMTITASDSAICPGNQVTFTGSALQANANSYIFSINSTPVQSGDSNTYTSSALVNNDTITVTGTLNGCVGKPSAPVIETVFNLPTLSISSNAPNNSICHGGRVVFTAVPSNYHGYQFYENGVLVQSGTSPTYTTDSITNGEQIYATAIQPGCPPPPSDTLTMSIVAGPTVTAGSNITSCYPASPVSLTGTPTGGFWTGQGIIDSLGTFYPDTAGVGTWTLTYTYIDTSNGCMGQDSIIGTVSLAQLQGFQNTVQICHDSIQLSATGASTYVWSPSEGLSCDSCANPLASPAQTITYDVTATFSSGCIAYDSVLVLVNNLTTTPAFSDTSISAGQPIILVIDTMGSTGPVRYTWVPSDSVNNSHIPNPTVSPSVTTVYTLYDTSGGCTDSFSITVNVMNADTFAIPTAFTPNGDGHDDYFYPVFNAANAKGTGGAIVKSFRIYNHYGQLVYNNPSAPGWDGRFKGAEQPVGTYVYYLSVLFPEEQVEKHMEGAVTLLR